MNDQAKYPLTCSNEQEMFVSKSNTRKLLKIVVVILAVSVILIVTPFLTNRRQWTAGRTMANFMGSVRFSKKFRNLTFRDPDLNQDFLNIRFSHKMTSGLYSDKPRECPDSENTVQGSLACSPKLNLEFENDLHAVISETAFGGLTCHLVEWQTSDTSREISNCIQMNHHSYWYGGGVMYPMKWPLDDIKFESQPHLTQNEAKTFSSSDKPHFGPFLEPYFFSSDGAAVLVEPFLPLFVSINKPKDKDGKLCITSAFKRQYTSRESETKLLLKYLVCKDKTAKSVHQLLLKTGKIPFYRGPADVEILRKPIWSVQLPRWDSDYEKIVLSAINHIKSNKLQNSHLFINGEYFTEQGNFHFSKDKFPTAGQLFAEQTMPIGVEVFPYVPREKWHLFDIRYNESERSVERSQNSGHGGTDSPVFLDLTSQEAVEYYKSHLKNVTQVGGLKGFRFSGGFAMDVIAGLDESFLVTKGKLDNPNSYTKMYAQIASEFKGSVLMGSGYRSQSQTFIADAGAFVVCTGWGHLRHIIPAVFGLGFMGYPFSLMRPMNCYPDWDLYVRWHQLVTYLPVMEMAYTQDSHVKEIVGYLRSWLNVRNDELWFRFLAPAVDEAVKFGYPIVRPLWWIAPDDELTYNISDTFMLGDDLLVVPVLEGKYGHRTNYTYLPRGYWWRDRLSGELHEGGQSIHYEVELYEILTFEREDDPKDEL